MTIATWNVNGVRARQGELLAWLAAERPDVVCLQEIKAAVDQLPFELRDVEGYWSAWHGEKGYSGVALLVSRSLAPAMPVVEHPAFDFEQRIATITLPLAGDAGVRIASVYVPNGGKDFDAKLRFLAGVDPWAEDAARDDQPIVICGDPQRRAARARRPPEGAQAQSDRDPAGRAGGARAGHLARAGRRRPRPRSRQRPPVHVVGAVAQPQAAQHRLAHRLRPGIGGAGCQASSAAVQREVGSSDHGPVVVTFQP